MSENESFIDEVSAEVRRERLSRYLRRYGWIAIVVVVALVGTAAFVEWRNAGQRADARAFGDAVSEALANDAPEARREALLAIPADDARRALLVMLAADTLEDDAAEARTLDLLREVAGDTTVPQLYRDLATLKAAMLLQGRADPAEVLDLLEPLAIPGAPFELLALEQQALAQIGQDDDAAALETLRRILDDDAAPRGLQGRARQLIVALGGSLENGQG